jgi:cytochrome c-type biogenesis protein CcmH
MIAAQMADQQPPRRRITPATIALGFAGILAISAVGVGAYRAGQNSVGGSSSSGGDAEGNQAAANAIAADPAAHMQEVIAQLRQALQRDPDNHEGWNNLGMAFRASGDFNQAEQAFRRASELAPRNADYLAEVGEMVLLKGQQGASQNPHGPQAAPSPEAITIFRRVLTLDANNPEARYYLATIKDLGGDHAGAIDDLIALLRIAPAGAPWAEQVRSAVAAIAQQNHIDISSRLPPAPAGAPATGDAATAAIPGPNQQQMQAASSIPPSQQDQMVRGMVEGLATRLRQNPHDEQGWMRLMRSRMVLNDPTQARTALNQALAAFQNDAAAQGRLRTAAQNLGIPTG